MNKVKKAVTRALTGLVMSLCVTSALQAESLYREGTYRPLTADNKAFRVGDLLTVQVFENSSASTTADTGTRRNNAVSAAFSLSRNPSTAMDLAAGGSFDGGGRTQRANRLLATLTVLVKEVLPTGDLKVSGEQLLTVNEELQKVRLEGLVRPIDISDGNIVLSTRLADATITYVGEGHLSERQRRSLWRTVLDWLGL